MKKIKNIWKLVVNSRFVVPIFILFILFIGIVGLKANNSQISSIRCGICIIIALMIAIFYPSYVIEKEMEDGKK